jgi:hypothetical protein
MCEALIWAQFIKKGGIDFSSDFNLASLGLAEPPPGTNIEKDFAASTKELLELMIGGKQDGTAVPSDSE